MPIATDSYKEGIGCKSTLKSNPMQKDILVVAGSKSERFGIHALLSPAYDITSVSDGMSALYQLRRNPLPSLIVVDPDLDDFPDGSFVRHLRKSIHYSSIPLIVVSGLSKEELEHMAERHGLAACLPKPLDPTHLERAVGGVLMAEAR